MKKLTGYLFIMALVLGFSITGATTGAKASTKKITINVGKTKTIKLSNNTKKIKWTTSNSKVIKILSSNNKKAKIKGLKKGSAYVKAKVENKTYRYKITVKKAKSLTVSQATKKLKKWLKDTNKESKGAILRYDSKQNGKYMFQYYHDMGTHTATVDWYYVDYKSGEITAMFGF